MAPDDGDSSSRQRSPARLLLGGVRQHPKMAATAPGSGGVLAGRGEHASARRTGMMADGIVKPVDRWTGSDGVAALAHGFGQRDEIVLIGVGGQRAGMPNQIPSARCGDATGVADAEVPGVRFACGCQRTDHRRRVRIDERQRRHRIVRTPRSATATRNIHDREVIVRKRPDSAGHAWPDPGCSTVTIAG
jgi:hypothetical protein